MRDRSLLWPAVALVAVVAAFCLGGLLLMPAADRPELVHGAGSVMAPAVGTILAAVAAAVAALAARASHKETQAQTPIIQAAADAASAAEVQTNGQLTARLNKAISDALDARGMTVPEQAGEDVEQYDPSIPAPVVMPPVGAG